MNKGYCCIGLFNPKSPENVGSVLRAAGCYGVNSVFNTGVRYDKRDALKQKDMKREIDRAMKER